MTSLRIAQLAERSGFSPTTLRYYEQLGLLEPPVRSTAGYRLYDEAALDRLAFIDRAKRMGFALDEIGELVQLWSAGDCPPVQHRMRALLDSRRREVRGQIAELQAFVDQLDDVAGRLDENSSATGCGPGCGCEVQLPGTRVRAATAPKRSSAPAPIACSLEAAALSERQADWRTAAEHATVLTATPAGVYARFPLDPALVADLARLVALEMACCPFFTIKLDMAPTALELWIEAPEGAADLARDLLGHPGPERG